MYVIVVKFRMLRLNVFEFLEIANDLEKVIKVKVVKIDKVVGLFKVDSVEGMVSKKVDEMVSGVKNVVVNDEKDLEFFSYEKFRSFLDSKVIIKILIIGMKIFLWSIMNFNGFEFIDLGLDSMEFRCLVGFICNGVKCM